ncbi:MAG: hypothetical protein D6826_09475 [Alphaproteobacteria bacterium]|nr:MAG: hypothetical protein D6826_09475 [Alphaproteobacteria bacterium]
MSSVRRHSDLMRRASGFRRPRVRTTDRTGIRMLRPFALACVLLMAVVAPALGQWKILYYDKNGQVVGVRKNPTDRKVGTAPAAGPAGESARAAATARIVAGEVIVANAPRGFTGIVRALGFAVLERASLRALAVDVFRLRVPRGLSVPAAIVRLRQRFPGITVDANHLLEASAVERTPELHARRLMGWRSPPPWCGRGVRIGIIDGAVDVRHPALAGRAIEYRAFQGPGHRPGAASHGTAIAAMIVGAAPWGGLLPGAELKAANIFEATDSGGVSANVFGLMKAVDWMVAERVHVLNLSVAGSRNAVLGQILDLARRRGLVMVAAAGNGGAQAPPAYPAAYDFVIAVTAVDVRGAVYRHANRGRYIDFAAPGVGIWTAVPGGGRAQSGTSFAAPYVSVLAALEVAGGRARNVAVVRERLRTGVDDLGAPGRDEVYGWGLVRLPRSCASPHVAG